MTSQLKYVLSQLVSIVLIPLLAPTYLFVLILFYFPQLTPFIELNDKLRVVLFIFSATTIIPFIAVFILYKLRVISSVTLDKQEDRTYPQLFSSLNYLLITLYISRKLGIGNALSVAMFAVTLSLFALTIITKYWKISTHTTGAMGMLSILTILMIRFPSEQLLIPYGILCALTVAVFFARLHLKVHTLAQVIIGSILGGIIGSTVVLFLM